MKSPSIFRSPAGLTRRQWLQTTAVGMSACALSQQSFAADPPLPFRPKVAAILTSFTYRSHAHVLLENFLQPYLFLGEATDPGCEIVSLYADQQPKGDMAPAIAMQFNVPQYPTIEAALCLGGKKLAVDAVLAIGEHGEYPLSPLGQMEYPRKRFFDECAKVMNDSGRVVPLFNDKHLSFRQDWSQEMYDEAQRLKMPLMAGSSVPLAQRRPAVEFPAGAKLEEAISIHSGPVESYDFHGAEVLQSINEFRQGGETGIKSIEFLTADALWKAAEAGRWSVELANAAMRSEQGEKFAGLKPSDEKVKLNHGILLTYHDGLKASILSVSGGGTQWSCAAKIAKEAQPWATSFYVGPWQNRNLFKALSHAIQHFFRTGKAPYPVERTLLTSKLMDCLMHSRAKPGEELLTPELAISYQSQDFRAFRENGATWKLITDDVPQPPGIEPLLMGKTLKTK